MRYIELMESGQIPPQYTERYNGGHVMLYDAGLTSLEGLPNHVTGELEISKNPLPSLAGCPQEVDGSFDCGGTLITNLVGGPQKIGGRYYCASSQLQNLEGAPREIPGRFFVNITAPDFTCQGAPDIVGEYVVGDSEGECFTSMKPYIGSPGLIRKGCILIPKADQPTFSLSGIQKCFKVINGYLEIDFEGKLTNVLGILAIKGITQIRIYENSELMSIIQDHLHLGKQGMMKLQTALIQAGLKDAAKL